jgi:hypothetical protein
VFCWSWKSAKVRALTVYLLLLLVNRTVYDDLKNFISVNQHSFMKNRSTVTNFLDFFYTDFSKGLRHQLLLEEMSVGIEPDRCL